MQAKENFNNRAKGSQWEPVYQKIVEDSNPNNFTNPINPSEINARISDNLTGDSIFFDTPFKVKAVRAARNNLRKILRGKKIYNVKTLMNIIDGQNSVVTKTARTVGGGRMTAEFLVR